jgi:ubiquinone/menaquinone biosynthesis C-methylase UbiE
MPPRMLTREETRRVYDRMGAFQDTQAFYEDRGTGILVAHGAFESAHRVLEFGCGTGRFAERLLSRQLPPDARYRALDLSPTMVALARKRLAPFGERAEVVQTDGSPPVSEPAGSRDRFVSNYVLDLLAEDDIRAVVREAHRVLEPGGLLCVASLTGGIGPASRVLSRTWSWLHALRPALVGGCRPLELASWLPAEQWRLRHQEKVAPFGVPLQAVVAERC